MTLTPRRKAGFVLLAGRGAGSNSLHFLPPKNQPPFFLGNGLLGNQGQWPVGGKMFTRARGGLFKRVISFPGNTQDKDTSGAPLHLSPTPTHTPRCLLAYSNPKQRLFCRLLLHPLAMCTPAYSPLSCAWVWLTPSSHPLLSPCWALWPALAMQLPGASHSWSCVCGAGERRAS